MNCKEEEIDIEDPDFWKKMIGEGNVVADEQSLDRRRSRAPMNYSESLNNDENVIGDIDSVESAAFVDEEEEEEYSSPVCEWRRNDIETIIVLLSSFGYGRLPWNDLLKRANLSQPYESAEVRVVFGCIVSFDALTRRS